MHNRLNTRITGLPGRSRFRMAKIGVQCALARRLSGRHGLFPHPDVELKPRTYSVKRTPIGRSILTVFCIVWIALLLSRYGPCPIGGDPELMYKPIKSELKRSLDVGRLPFWSNRFGVGVPLVAESHVAAFYPPNWLLYRLFNVELAYKMAMWLHWLASLSRPLPMLDSQGSPGRAQHWPQSFFRSADFRLCISSMSRSII